LKTVGIDLFAGAGGLSLGAAMAGIDIQLSIEADIYAAETYRHNHPETKMLNSDIRNINSISINDKNCRKILFGGPPCQGFSTSNQKTRTQANKGNWLFQEFFRIAKLWEPDIIVFENVAGLRETEKGFFLNEIILTLQNMGYIAEPWCLCASDFGVPQKRARLFIIGSKSGKIGEPRKTTINNPVTVNEAIGDLPILKNGASENILKYKREAKNPYAKLMRGKLNQVTNNLVTKNSELIIKRYGHIPQGGNWENIPKELMENYQDRSRCHTGIYHKLRMNKPSVVIGNYRKNMLIHPTQNRGLSVREAARLQSFPDTYEFKGTIGYQQQQVGNAVPPLLAKAVFDKILL